ncbi:MAG TPA: restriction endonuclease, partial [Polyangiales bacterium]
MITSQTPTNWRALQQDVARILTEAGFSADVEKVVANARGQAEIDVYAEEIIQGRRYVVLVECKNWSAAIPQNVVHGFRTVVTDTGANVGYIVSANGFQSGAIVAAQHSNVKLVTWQEFQDTFEPTWLERYLFPTMEKRLAALWSFTEPLYAAPPRSHPSQVPLGPHQAAWWAYADPAWVLDKFTSIQQGMRGASVPRLPLRSYVKADVAALMPSDLLDAVGYREFLNAAIA